MHFGFALELSHIDLWSTDLLDTHLGLLNPEISIQISPVSILFVSIKSLRGLQDMSSRHLQDMSSRRLQDMFSRRLQDMSSRRLEDIFSVTIFRLPRRLQNVLEDVKLLRWRRVEDVFKTNKCLLGMKKSCSWRIPVHVRSSFHFHLCVESHTGINNCVIIRLSFPQVENFLFPPFKIILPYLCTKNMNSNKTKLAEKKCLAESSTNMMILQILTMFQYRTYKMIIFG